MNTLIMYPRQWACLSLLLCLPGALSAQAPKILDDNVEVEIKELRNLNSRARETNISITPNGQRLYYMSDRGQMPWSQPYGTWQGSMRYDGDIWFAEKTGSTWGKASCLEAPVNTSNGEDEPNVSPNGNTVTFQSWRDTWERDGGPYYSATISGGTYGQPKGLGGGITRFFENEFRKYNTYATDGASVSPDGKRFIVAAGDDYDGYLDLYMSTMGSDGEWGYLKKLSISTSKDERSVFWGSDSKTLFFSSSGYGGFGGLDIFKTTIEDNGTFGEIVNMGSKFNTSKDDYGFILTATGEEAYFVRDGDIFQGIFKDPPPEIAPEATAMVHGTIKDGRGRVMKVQVKLVDAGTGEELHHTHTYASNGKYSIFLSDVSKEYKIAILQEGEPLEDKAFEIDKSKLYSEYKVDFVIVEKEAPFEAPIVEKKVFENIYFRNGSAVIEMKGRIKLDHVSKYLKDHETVHFQVTGFPDARGSLSFNEKLAKDRANAVGDYIVRKGVAPGRISVESFKKAQESTVHHDTKLTSYQTNRVEISIMGAPRSTPGGETDDRSGMNVEPKTRAINIVVPEEELHPDMAKVLEGVPENAAEFMERGFAHAIAKKYDEAIGDYTKALELDAELNEAFHFRGMAKREKGDYAGALEDYNHFILLDPSNDLAIFSRSQLLIKLGDTTAACADLRHIQPHYPDLTAPIMKVHCQSN